MSDEAAPSTRRYAVIVPVKPPAFAKSRLAPVGDRARADLAAAFATDTVTAALECDLVSRVLVVTDDHVLAGAMSGLGADVLPDATTDDLNATLAQAAAEVRRRDPTLGLVALCADLPALRPHELAQALAAADPGRMSIVADADGVGTTMVVAPDLESFRPAFGAGSRQRHIESGAAEIDLDVPTLRRDVDEPADLEQAVGLGVGPRTAMVTTLLHLG